MQRTSSLKESMMPGLRRLSTSATMIFTVNLADEYSMRYEHGARSPELWKNRHWYGAPFKWFLGCLLRLLLKPRYGISGILRKSVLSFIAECKEPSLDPEVICSEIRSNLEISEVENLLLYCFLTITLDRDFKEIRQYGISDPHSSIHLVKYINQLCGTCFYVEMEEPYFARLKQRCRDFDEFLSTASLNYEVGQLPSEETMLKYLLNRMVSVIELSKGLPRRQVFDFRSNEKLKIPETSKTSVLLTSSPLWKIMSRRAQDQKCEEGDC